MTRRALLLINPRARQGGELRDTVAACLEKAGLDIVVELLGDERTAIGNHQAPSPARSPTS